MFAVKKLQAKIQNHWLFSSSNIYLSGSAKKSDEKKK